MIFKSIDDIYNHLDTLGMFHMKAGQSRVLPALEALNLIPLPYPAIQIVGTNGKGSTATFIAQLAKEHKLKVGLYTSPHFVSPKERVLLNNKELSDELWVTLAQKVYDANPELTYFEFITVFAALAYKEAKVDLALFEAGLGGKFDATTALACEATVFTPIALDHTHILGSTITEIAEDKAHALSEKSKIAISSLQTEEAQSVLEKTAKSFNCPLFSSSHTLLPTQILGLTGEHQLQNAQTALTAWRMCYTLFFNAKSFITSEQKALEKAFIPGRMQYISQSTTHKHLLLDGGHNPHGLLALKKALTYTKTTPKAVIFSCMADKDLVSIIPHIIDITQDAPLYVTQISDNARAAYPSFLAKEFDKYDRKVFETKSIAEALDLTHSIETCPTEPILICGSLYLLADFFILFPMYIINNN